MFWFYLQFMPIVPWLALCWLFVRPLKLPRAWALLCALALLALSQKHVWFKLAGGDMLRPEIPLWLHFAANWGPAFSLSLLFLCLLPPYHLPKGGKAARWRAAIASAVAAVIATLALWEGARAPSVRVVEVPVPGLPADLDGFRIAHLSDLHDSVATIHGQFDRIAETVNSLAPDVVCITGDFVDGTPETRGGELSGLSQIRASSGVYGCSGNHDAYSGFALWRPILQSYGIEIIDGRSVTIPVGSSAVSLGAVADGAFGSLRPFGGGGDAIADAFAGAPAESVKVLLRHRPDGLADAADRGIALQLSGHTHGGQIPLLDLLIARFNEGHVRGLYREGGTYLHVSPGTGQWAGFPYRLFIRSEITLLVLRPIC